MRANSSLAPSEYRGPVLGLIFLAYAEHRFDQVSPDLEAKASARRPVQPDDYKARSVLSCLSTPGCPTWSACPRVATWEPPWTRPCAPSRRTTPS
ncbi:MAG: hypothetical protein WKF76_08930 [Nocardioidaceae bacterium]